MTTEQNVSPAQELRAAASKIRTVSTNATHSGPWKYESFHVHTESGLIADAYERGDGAHIALWNPGVAELVADWLVSAAAIAEQGKDPSCVHRPIPSAALRVARAINGGA